MNKNTFLKIYFPNGSFHALRYTASTTVADLIRTVLKGRLSPYELSYQLLFAIRISPQEKCETKISASNLMNSVEKWLHPMMTMDKVQSLHGDIDQLKVELRLRYFPSSLDTLTQNKSILSFFYEQLRIDYMRCKSEHVPTNIAIELGSLEIRKLFKDLNSTALDKKVNIDYLEKELGLRTFFPQSLIDSQKTRVVRKCIKVCLKKYEGLAEEECVKRFCFLLKDVWNWEQETFPCNLGAEWAVPISLVLGPAEGISYRTQNSSKLTKMASFADVISISTNKNHSIERSLLQLTIAGSSETLTLSFPSQDEAEAVAILIDGYCMLANQTLQARWRSMLGDPSPVQARAAIPPPFLGPHPSEDIAEYRRSIPDSCGDRADDDDDHDSNGDYAEVLSPDYQIDRKQIQMIESLGNGQFGEVYRGILKTDQQLEINIAIKTCKVPDIATTEAFLEEAYVMQRFHHPHIIKLIGVCPEQPILLIMELARLGELRSYLIANRSDFDLLTLILYCEQLASALAYLESKKFVHRDIAARNVLVSNHESVKLADFGLSRKLTLENSYYKASKGKLPIKWMAPESINFRRFTHLSDVWMFSVCMWEILSLGRKPFQGIANTDVINQIENGVRLPLPGSYCPSSLYDLWQKCWSYEPTNRPNFVQIESRLKTITQELQSDPNASAQKISLNDASEDRIPPKPALPATHRRSVGHRSESNHRLQGRVSSESKISSSPSNLSTKSLEASSSSSSLLIDQFHNQTKQIINAVLALTRQTDIDEDLNSTILQHLSLNSINDREQMQLVKSIAIAVRDLLQTLDYAPVSIKEMSEKRYSHFSGLVVSLIEAVRQRNYTQTYEYAVNVARTAKSLFNDILQLS